MSVDSFRLESFRPWNPFQDKVQPSRDSIDICRYPTPVSITATTSLSDSSNSAPENTNADSCGPVMHPLPPRLPSEVCLSNSQEMNPRQQSDLEDQTSCVDPGIDAFDFDDILQLQDIPSSGDEDHLMICEDLGIDSQDSLGFESGSPRLQCTARKNSDADNAGVPALSRECSDATIDPAILDDHHFHGIEQSPERNENLRVVSPPTFLNQSSHSPGLQPGSQRVTDSPRQRSKVSKVAVVVDNRHMSRTGRSTRANRPLGSSFSALRDQFSSLPVEDRLRFLSWLFEGALSQCLHTPTRRNSALLAKDVERQEGFAASSSDQPSADDGIVPGQLTCSSRKGLRWSPEEKRFLVQLREEKALSWSDLINKFLKRFPGRSEGSIQVYWSTTLKKH